MVRPVLSDGKGPYGLIINSVQACFEVQYGREIHSESNKCKVYFTQTVYFNQQNALNKIIQNSNHKIKFVVTTTTCFDTGMPSTKSLLEKRNTCQHANPGTDRPHYESMRMGLRCRNT